MRRAVSEVEPLAGGDRVSRNTTGALYEEQAARSARESGEEIRVDGDSDADASERVPTTVDNRNGANDRVIGHPADKPCARREDDEPRRALPHACERTEIRLDDRSLHRRFAREHLSPGVGRSHEDRELCFGRL